MIDENNSMKNERHELLSFLLIRKLVYEYAPKYYASAPSREKLDVLAVEVMNIMTNYMSGLKNYEDYCEIYENAKNLHPKIFVREKNDLGLGKHEVVEMDEAFSFFKHIARRLPV